MLCTGTSSLRCSTRTEPALGLDPRDERCFLPIDVYDTATARPVAVLLRAGKTPTGEEIRGHLRRLVRRIRTHWPETRLTIRGDSHYGRHDVIVWCEANGLDYFFVSGAKLGANIERCRVDPQSISEKRRTSA